MNPNICPGCGRKLVREPDGEKWCPSCVPIVNEYAKEEKVETE